MEILMPRLSTKSAMLSKLEALDTLAKDLEQFSAGFHAGFAIGAPTSERPVVSADLERGHWSVDERGRRIWVRTP
jgi:hypothetical protein